MPFNPISSSLCANVKLYVGSRFLTLSLDYNLDERNLIACVSFEFH